MKLVFDADQLGSFEAELPGIRERFNKLSLSSMPENYGIAGNTFRAYTNWPKRPSQVYKSWAEKVTKQFNEKPPKRIHAKSQEEFDKWHQVLFDALQDHWKKNQGGTLSIAHGYKIIDLYLKNIAFYNFGDRAFTNSIVQYGNCALDKQILNKLNLCMGGCLPIRNPSMGHITNMNCYRFCQSLITEFCGKAKGTRVEYDTWAWQLRNRTSPPDTTSQSTT